VSGRPEQARPALAKLSSTFAKVVPSVPCGRSRGIGTSTKNQQLVELRLGIAAALCRSATRPSCAVSHFLRSRLIRSGYNRTAKGAVHHGPGFLNRQRKRK